MTTKKRKQTEAEEHAADQAVEFPDEQETAAEKVARLKAELALAKAVVKADSKSARVPCSFEGCKLFAMPGREDNRCSNHRPAIEKLTADQRSSLYTAMLTETNGHGGKTGRHSV